MESVNNMKENWQISSGRDNTDVPIKSTSKLVSPDFHQNRRRVKPLHFK